MTDAGALVAFEVGLSDGVLGVHQGDTTTRDDALFDCGAGCAEGVLDAVLALLELDFGCGADLDDGDGAGELAEALLKLLAVPVGGRVLERGLDLGDAAVDVLTGTVAFDDGRLVLLDDDAAGAAQVLNLNGVEAATQVVGDYLAAGEGSDVAEVLLAAVAEARGLDADDVHRAAQLVHCQRGERLTIDVLGDDQHVLADLEDASRGWAGRRRRP